MVLIITCIETVYLSYQCAVLAQLVERMAFNHVVVGSIPTDGVLPLVVFSTFLSFSLRFLFPELGNNHIWILLSLVSVDLILEQNNWFLERSCV